MATGSAAKANEELTIHTSKPPMASKSNFLLLLSGAITSATLLAQGPPPPPPPLAPPPQPPQNQNTPQKVVLGKALFWDEQLSHDDTVACGTCHQPSAGGGDPREELEARHPGPDGLFGTPDDRFGSLGVVRTDQNGDFTPDATFGHSTQATGRATPSNLTGAYMIDNFWDGRATSEFRDPLTNQVVIPVGGSLESQALGPILSSVEMAGEGRTWDQVIAKLESVQPLALATNLTPDLSAALGSGTVSYPDLFQAAFGTQEITPVRIAFAIAAYERTLVPNQTPADAFFGGNNGALTPGQQQGVMAFGSPGLRCAQCHAGSLFSDNQFHNLGLRPIAEDSGRQAITGNNADRGKFKTPSLRNIGLRGSRFFHTGSPGINTLQDLFTFYDQDGGPNADNKDPILNGLIVPQMARAGVEDFLMNALTDPRAAAEMPPFDRPSLASESHQDKLEILPGAQAGSGGFVPKVIAMTPPHLGNPDWRLGVYDGLGGANAVVTISVTPPSSPIPGFTSVTDVMQLEGTGAGQGYQTWHRELPSDSALIGTEYWLQWRIRDTGAPAAVAKSPFVHMTIF